jgi:DNA processing protein
LNADSKSAYLFLSLLQARVGVSVISRLGSLSPEELAGMRGAEAAARVGMTENAARAFDELKSGFDAREVIGHLAEKDIQALTPADRGYPERLMETPDPPPALFVSGQLPEGPAVALVGSRKASISGVETARGLGRALAERGVCVVSGLALGIDAAAHEGALDGDGPTVGVLGCGIDVVYPRTNRALFEQVRRRGAIISEYYLGEAPLAWRFPARNRIIAGLSDVLVVVEAAERSGALITARHAMQAGRDVWAVPGPAGAAGCRGSNKLLSDGAGVLWDVEEFAEYVAPARKGKSAESADVAQEALPEGLPENETRALAGVGFEASEVDVISGRSGLGVRELLPALTLLELKGYVARDQNGAFARRRFS